MNKINETDIKNKLKSLMANVFEITDPEDIPDNSSMKTMAKWDSIAHVDLLLGIETTFKIKTLPDEIGFTLSFPDIVKFVLSKIDDKVVGVHQPSNEAALSWEELFSGLWAHDQVRDNDTLYIHSRTEDVFSVCGGSLTDAYRILRGEGRTLVFPSFAFTGSSYSKYVEERPRFSVKDTSALTGLMPELVRAEQGVYRSAHPLLSECAIGPKAKWIIQDAHTNPLPFHADSTYARLMELDAAMIGLGVNINTNAIIHMVDDKFRSEYPFDIYMKEPLCFEIELADSRVVKRDFVAYAPDVLKKIKPIKLRPYFKDSPHILNEFEIYGVWFYMLRVRPFIERCTIIAADCLKKGELPPWYL